jgi:hypothetical protein
VIDLTLPFADRGEHKFAMRLSRGFSLSTHGGIECAAGIAMMFAPAVLGFGAAALIVSASLGAILTGVGLALTERRSQALSHSHFDSLYVVTTALAALAFASAGSTRAAIFFAAVVGVLAPLHFTTRYVAAG